MRQSSNASPAGRLIWLVTIFAVVTSLFSFRSWAATSSNAANDPNAWMREDRIYKETYKLCKDHPGIVPEDLLATSLFKRVLMNSGVEAFKAASFEPSSILSLYADHGLSQAYVNLAQWPPFRLAVKTCYPHSKLRQNIFTNRLFLADVVGKEAGISMAVGAGYLTIRGFRYLKQVAPRLEVAARYLLGAAMLIYAANIFRKMYFGPTVSEQKAMQAKMDKLILTVPREIDKQNLILYTETITYLENVLATLPPDNPMRAQVAYRIQELANRRAQIADRIQKAAG